MSDFDTINQFYRDFPPEHVLDDQGVRHINEIPHPAEYGQGHCECGEHSLESDTWYHKGMVMPDYNSAAVYRACKTCGEFLLRKRK